MNNDAGDPGAPTGQASIDRRAWSRGRQYRATLLGVGVLALIVLGTWLSGRLLAKPAAPAEAAAPPPGTFRATAQQMKTLTIEPVRVRDFVSEELTEGKIAVDADRETLLYSPYSGRVTRVIASPGDRVKKGAPLATLEASEFVQGQNDLANGVVQLKLARINETRKHALYDAKGGSLQDWQQAQADLVAAETALGAARNRLRILGKTDAEIDGLESAHTIDPVATLAAPIAGIVVDRQLGQGQYLQSGASTPVFTIADASTVWLLANVREADSGRVRLGQIMEVRVPAYPQRTFEARVTYVSALVDPVTHRLPVRAQLDNRDGALKPEMFASFRIMTSDASQSLAVPEQAIVYEGDGAHVWIATGDLLAYRAIGVGRHNEGWVEVLDGLKPGENIVTKGGLFIDQVATPPAS